MQSIPRARRFYERYFGFSKDTVQERGFLIVRNPNGFDLALAKDRARPRMPRWFHFGFRLRSRKAVRALHDRMRADGVRIESPLADHGSWMSFACEDPDGYIIEVYYE